MTLLTPKWPPACPKKDEILKVEKMIAIIKFLIESKTLVRNFSVFMATLKGTITDWLIGSFYPNFPHWDHKNIKNVPKFSKTSRKYQKIKTTFPKSWQNKKKKSRKSRLVHMSGYRMSPRHSGITTVYFEHTSHLFLVLMLFDFDYAFICWCCSSYGFSLLQYDVASVCNNMMQCYWALASLEETTV